MKFNEVAKGLAKPVTQQLKQKRLSVRLTGIALACLGLVTAAQAQTSLVCDPAGDTTFSSGKGGPALPPWLDIVQAQVSAGSGGTIIFTLTMNAPVPVAPAWSGVDDGGQLWWGWRLVGDLATDYTVKNKCVKSAGSSIPAGYFLDLIWDVTSASFQARLLDDTTCATTAIPFGFSPDRTQITMVLPSGSLSNPAVIADPNNFQFLAAIEVWKANTTGNISFFTVDLAPNAASNGQLVAAPWSTSSNATFCP